MMTLSAIKIPDSKNLYNRKRRVGNKKLWCLHLLKKMKKKRIWKEKINFVNPIFESINYEKAAKSSLILGSKNANYEDDIFDKINALMV